VRREHHIGCDEERTPDRRSVSNTSTAARRARIRTRRQVPLFAIEADVTASCRSFPLSEPDVATIPFAQIKRGACR